MKALGRGLVLTLSFIGVLPSLFAQDTFVTGQAVVAKMKDQSIGTVSDEQVFSLSATSGEIAIQRVSYDGNVEDFTVIENGCSGKVLKTGEACLIRYRFSPKQPGVRALIVTLAHSGTGSPVTYMAVGNGAAPAVKGDVNGDGRVTVQDAVLVLRIVVGLSSETVPVPDLGYLLKAVTQGL